jgi:polysaccharide export outer membrane protein
MPINFQLLYLCKNMFIVKIINYFILFFVLVAFLFSCASKKNYHYFINQELKNEVINDFSPKIKTGDLIDVIVLSQDKISSEPFNLPTFNSSVRSGYINGIAVPNGYLVRENGEITFPVIGSIYVKGMTTIEVADILKLKLKDYILNPIIHVKIENFKVTVLGEVKNPGTFLIPNERVTIFEAIGLAGDLTINGQRKDVVLIRDIDGVKSEIIIDLTSKSIITSKFYYLSQNDVLYIKPNQAKVNSSTMSSSYGMFISIASLVITTVNLLVK